MVAKSISAVVSILGGLPYPIVMRLGEDESKSIRRRKKGLGRIRPAKGLVPM